MIVSFAMLVLKISAAGAATSATSRAGHRIPFAAASKTKASPLALDIARSVPRGGNVLISDEDDEDEDEEDEDDNETSDIRQHPEYEKLQAYRMKQQVLLQLRATFLSEALAKRGLPIPSLRDVSTPDGRVPPKKIDWDCALSTEADPKHCLISYEPEPGSKLLVPMELASTDKWITLSALNRLRRDDTTKVEPMWNDKYAILSSWFGANSRYSLLQHVGPKGVILSMLLDRNRLPIVVGFFLILAIIQLLPIIEILANRFLVSGYLWSKWFTWHRYVHIGLPFKLLIVQTIFSYAAKGFSVLVSLVKDKLVDLECQILEETIPLTVGEGSQIEEFEDVDITDDDSSSTDGDDEE